MTLATSTCETLIADLAHDPEHAAVFRRLLDDYPEELTMEVVSAALRRQRISAAEAISMVRECDFGFRRTLVVLAAMGHERGWRARDLVVEALEGQPH